MYATYTCPLDQSEAYTGLRSLVKGLGALDGPFGKQVY